MSMFKIEGYWKDEPEQTFTNQLVNEYDDSPKGYEDDDIFYYGLSESDIREAIELGSSTTHDFVITSYERVENG